MGYRIKVSLNDSEHEIWRRLDIPAFITFSQLHQIIQVAFGWQSYHLYKFEINKTVITTTDPDFAPGELYGDEALELDSEKTFVDKYLCENDELIYTYDFGDYWEHKIVVEKRLKQIKSSKPPVCIAGARSRPPEDVGGMGGYETFLEIIRDDKNPEREEMLEWAKKDTKGKKFDPMYFNAEQVNEKLLYAITDTREFAKILFTDELGLFGDFSWDFFGPFVKGPKGNFTWDRIGDLLQLMESGCKIEIKVTKSDK